MALFSCCFASGSGKAHRDSVGCSGSPGKLAAEPELVAHSMAPRAMEELEKGEFWCFGTVLVGKGFKAQG